MDRLPESIHCHTLGVCLWNTQGFYPLFLLMGSDGPHLFMFEKKPQCSSLEFGRNVFITYPREQDSLSLRFVIRLSLRQWVMRNSHPRLRSFVREWFLTPGLFYSMNDLMIHWRDNIHNSEWESKACLVGPKHRFRWHTKKYVIACYLEAINAPICMVHCLGCLP